MADPRSEKSTRAKSIGHYILMKTIGEGTFGKVKLGTHILTGERVAVKVLEKERIVDIADVERVAREIHILKLIRQCRHIIQLYEIIETPRQLYLIMEYAPGGELFDYIVEHGRAEEKDACKFLHQILAGVERVHAMNVVHRDLKPENLLLDDRQDIKIVDFGLSNTHQDGQLLQTACGSPCYAAPEMIAGHKYVPPMIDIWSCGVILFALVCGFLPFEDQNHAELYKKILNAEYEMPNFVSSEVADLIAGMLTTDPDKRMKLADIRGHVWYRQIPEASLIDREEQGCLEEDILDQLDSYGFPRDYAIKCLKTNKHNHVTTTYHLIKEKRLRAQHAGSSRTSLRIADIDATCHEDVCQTNGHRHQAVGSKADAAVALVATPSRGSRCGEVHGNGGTPANGDADGPQDHVSQAHMSSRSPRIVPPADATAEAVHGGHRGGGRSSSTQPPAGPSGARGGRPHSSRRGWTGTPRGPGGVPYSARGGGRYDHRASSSGPSGPRRRPLSMEPGAVRRAASPWGGSSYRGNWDGPRDDFEVTPTSGRRQWSARGGGEPPMSARARLQGDSGVGPIGVPPAAWGSGRSPSGSGYDDTTSGTFQVSCNSARPPRQIMQEAMKALGSNGISFRQTSNFVVRCQSHGVRFQAEIHQLDRGGGFALRFTRASGDVWHYKDICARLLSDMDL
eukprot:TRINITY_DN20371_c1_g1_i2.p1 TRINITY_DN20371_c1_g1~~TRINITY_DN20371_c1_g1_i2.p1  ORF type:complete len:680 (+),score=119.99 TRINITY_DN20371_c1_g1_i2:243-2282(+)